MSGMDDTGSREAVAVLLELGRIEQLAARPHQSPKKKLVAAGKSARRIRELLLKGATKHIVAEGGYVPAGRG